MQTPVIFLALALAIGVVIGTLIQDDAPEQVNSAAVTNTGSPARLASAPILPAPAQATADIASLQQRLQEEISARQALERKLGKLSKQVAVLQQRPRPVATTASGEAETTQATNPQNSENWFNEQALLDTGMDSGQASQLRSFFEQLEMERLYLRDQAMREEWDNQRLREAMQTLENRETDLKSQLGDKAYDAYLYASGQPNRVEVTSVLASSPAGTAGLMAGDQLVRYDNQRIYTGFDLREATTQGSANETVMVEVMRDGKPLQFYLPRGPLGIRMNSVSVQP